MTTARELRAFLDRPWAKVRASKDRYVADVIARDGAGEALRMADALRDHAAAMGAVPDSEARSEDLYAIVRLKELIDRASRRRARAR